MSEQAPQPARSELARGYFSGDLVSVKVTPHVSRVARLESVSLLCPACIIAHYFAPELESWEVGTVKAENILGPATGQAADEARTSLARFLLDREPSRAECWHCGFCRKPLAECQCADDKALCNDCDGEGTCRGCDGFGNLEDEDDMEPYRCRDCGGGGNCVTCAGSGKAP